MQPYSPFNKSLTELESSDLAALRGASEGWYNEYKEETPGAAALAKSLSAFSNTRGGWLFLGVREESKQNPVAGTFPGIARTEVDPSLQRLRKCAVDHLNPTPHFETLVLWGPDEASGLEVDRAVICIWIPSSASAPHVHKSGQIYRRVADASEPKPESDRFVLDQLWRRGDEIKARHKQWNDRDPEFSDAEKNQPYIRLMLVADPWQEHDIWIDDTEEVRQALGKKTGLVSAIPFDTVYTSAEGFVGRQLSGNDPQNLGLTWRLRRDLASDVILPLPLYQPRRPELLAIDLHGYLHAERFIELVLKHGTNCPRIVDLNFLFNILVGVAEIQERLCALSNWSGRYFVKIKLLNAWRTVPYLDVPEVLNQFEQQGMPMCLDSTSEFPRGSGPDNYLEVERGADVIDEARPLIQALRMFALPAMCYGVPRWVDNDSSTGDGAYYIALQEAGCRALEVQRRRNTGAKE